MDLVKSGAKEILYSFLLVNNTDQKQYRDLQTKMMNSYTQNRNIYPQSATDAKRMINNYIPKFVSNSSNKKKGKKQDKDEEPTKEGELLFLQQQDENWQYCGWCKKKQQASMMIVFVSSTLESPRQQKTQPQTKPRNKKIRPTESNKLKDLSTERISS